MSIFDDIAGALSNIFGGGAQQSSSSNSNTSSGSGSQRSDYGDNDSLATNNTGKKTTNKQTTSREASGSGPIDKKTYNPKLGTEAGSVSATGQLGNNPGYNFSTIRSTQAQPNDYVINYDGILNDKYYTPNSVSPEHIRKRTEYKDTLTEKNKEAAKEYARNQVRSAAGDNDDLAAAQQDATNPEFIVSSLVSHSVNDDPTDKYGNYTIPGVAANGEPNKLAYNEAFITPYSDEDFKNDYTYAYADAQKRLDKTAKNVAYKDNPVGKFLSEMPNPLEAIGSWINPEAAEATTLLPQQIQTPSGQQDKNSEQRSDYGDNDSLAVQTQDNAGENKEETDENGHTIYKQGNKFGRGVADAYSAATTGDSRVSMDDAIIDDAYKMTGDERYNRNSDKYYKKHVGEKGYEDIDPYDIDGYMDFGEFISGVNKDGTPVTRKQTRQYLMQHPNLGAYVLSSSLLGDAIKSGQLDKAAYKNFVVDYVNDMYDNPRSIEDMQNAYVGAQQDGTTSDFYNQWATGNSFADGATDFGNYLEKLYTDSLMKNGANTDYKWYNDWANDLLKNGIYSDGNLDSNPAATTDTYTYQNAANDYNAATAADSTLSDEQKSNALANYNAASDKLAAQLALMGQLVTAGQNPGSLNLDSIDNSVIKNYNKAFNYGDMDKLTDLGTSNGYYASDKYTPEALDASGYAPLGASIAAENPDTNNAFGIAAGGALTAMNPSMGLASVIGNIANKLASEEAKKTTQAIDNAEDQGSALYDQYRSQSGTDAKGNEYPAFSRAYDSGVSVDTPSGVKDFYKRMGANGLSVYNTNNSGALSKDSVQKYMTDTYNANANNINLPTDDLNLAGKYMKDPTSLTDEEQKQLIGIIGAYADKANHDINPIITSLMARAYAAPTDSPSSLVYTFTPNNLKTALSTGEDENQG